jgi:soluble lytic murein transglycosylase-like protein
MELQGMAAAAARAYNIPEGIFLGLIESESSWNPDAISLKGAIGLTQVLPATARMLGYDPQELARNPLLQLEVGCRYLSEMYNMFKCWDKALAAYNAGPHNVQKYNGIPPFKVTQSYVKRILEYAEEYKRGKNTENEI